jgi:Na+/proline symporter
MLTGACAFGAFAITMLRKNYKRATKGVATSGIVTGSQLQRGSGAAHRSYYPEVEFQTPSGERITFVASIGSNAEPKLGRKVKVTYFPDNPKDADISSLLSTWLFPLFCFLAATFFLMGSLFFYTNAFGDAG